MVKELIKTTTTNTASPIPKAILSLRLSRGTPPELPATGDAPEVLVGLGAVEVPTTDVAVEVVVGVGGRGMVPNMDEASADMVDSAAIWTPLQRLDREDCLPQSACLLLGYIS